MSKIEDTNVFSSANATIDPIAPKDCIFGCGAKINYDSTLPGPSYREVNTGLHHSFKRCAESDRRSGSGKAEVPGIKAEKDQRTEGIDNLKGF